MFMYILFSRQTMPQERLLAPKEEIRSYQFWKAVRCEFLITLLYVFVGCGTETRWNNKDALDEVKIALSFGLSAATLVQCVGHISGAHLNPAVTIAMLVTRNITVLRAVFYILAQCVGSIAGAGILYGVTPIQVHGHLGATMVHQHVGLGQAFGVEFMITFVMVFTVFANLEPKRADMGSRSLAIGLSVVLGHLFAVYWVGPVLGGIIGGFTYEYTQDSSNHLQNLRRSFRRKPASLKRSRSAQSTNSTASTEMTYTPTSEDLRI